MAGFLDAGERVIDLVLTDTGKQLLLKGDLRFSYWIPFDDEVNYQPTVTIWNSSSYVTPDELDDLAALVASASQSMTEDPVIREASMGYRGLPANQADNVNVLRPMYSAKPGIGHMSPLPEMVVSSDVVEALVSQVYVLKTSEKKDGNGNTIEQSVSPVGFQRIASNQAKIDLSYSTGSFTSDKDFEGFLITMYQDVSGTLQEVLHNRSSDGDIVYRNDLMLNIERK